MEMSENAPMPAVLFDPQALRLWRLAERLAGSAAGVRVLRARDAPAWPLRSGRWDEGAPHQHAVPTIVACLAGVVRIETARGPIDLQADEICVVAPAAWHAHAPLRGGSAAYGQGLVFARSDVVLSEPGISIAVQVPAEPVRGLLDRLVAQPEVATARRLVGSVTGGTAHPYAPHAAVSRMAHRMWAGLHLGIDAADVLAASGLGQRQAHRLFTGWFGTTPKQAILDQRLALAEALLAEGATVTAAAAATGFGDRRALSRLRRRRR
jgi:AraC-like DNA-binding protein